MPVAIFDRDFELATEALTYRPLIDGVALAIATERERCAKIAEKWDGVDNVAAQIRTAAISL